ncbi:MAG: hypothetical protein HY553_21875 [Elusimicrobia bacterium]|nr:hypothetical protein [Elusimicrobiota bacterium]
METLTESPVEEAPLDTELDKTEELEERDPAKLKQRKPPESGLCRRCGGNKPVNQLMLCYPCWVKSVLEEKGGWREGMPHPDWCSCTGLTEHARRSDGN